MPTFLHSWLDPKRVAEHETSFRQSKQPTATAFSVLEVIEHVCLAHYLLDGHHKSYAAAMSGCAMTLLSFLATEQSISTKEDIETLLTRMQSKA